MQAHPPATHPDPFDFQAERARAGLDVGTTPQREHRAATAARDGFLRVQQAEALRLQGRFAQAEAICETLLQSHPDYVAALHTLGLVFADQERHGDALNHLVRAVMLNPLSWAALTALAGVYLRLGATELAEQTIERAVVIEPHEAGVLLMQGDIRRAQCEYDLARDTYRRALTLEPEMVDAEIAMGWCCLEIGERSAAAEIFERIARRRPRLIEPLRALAALPGGDARLDLEARLQCARPARGDDESVFRVAAAFIRSAALDRAGRHAEAWTCAGDANRHMHREMTASLAHLAERRRAGLAALRGHRETSDCREPEGGESPISLFILGPSRSGKSTLEKLVGGLAGVKCGHENPIVETAVRRTFQLSALPTDSRLGQLPPPAYPLFRRIYLNELRRRAGPARVFTNTHSGCLFEAGSIATVLERARFILLKRDLHDNLLRIHLRHYGEANAYAYDLKATREHILWHHQMADLMAANFPTRARIVHYEDMIADPGSTLRLVAALCALPIPDGHSPTIAGDAGCAAPYREFIDAGLDP